MIHPPCERSRFDKQLDAFVMCARAVSQEAAQQLASSAADRPKKIAEGGGLILCRDCADDLALLAGNVRAVRAEWDTT